MRLLRYYTITILTNPKFLNLKPNPFPQTLYLKISPQLQSSTSTTTHTSRQTRKTQKAVAAEQTQPTQKPQKTEQALSNSSLATTSTSCATHIPSPYQSSGCFPATTSSRCVCKKAGIPVSAMDSITLRPAFERAEWTVMKWDEESWDECRVSLLASFDRMKSRGKDTMVLNVPLVVNSQKLERGKKDWESNIEG